MSPEHIRLDRLRLASERVAPAAKIEDLFAEARRLQNYVGGFDEVVQISGVAYAGKWV